MRRLSLVSGAVFGSALATLTGCGQAASVSSTSPVPLPDGGVYDVSFETSTPSSLPKCTSALAGTVAYVSSSSTLWSCSGGTWCQVGCSSSGAGDVAYV